MQETPVLALTIAYWLHLLATVLWVGGQSILFLVVFPISQNSLSLKDYHQLLTAINRRMSTIGGISLAVLIGTGLIQMSSNSNFTGFLSTDSQWAVSILLKHIAFIGIIAVSAYQTWSVAPAIERITLLQAKGRATEEDQIALRRREDRILQINLILSAVVLLFTALARVS